VRGPAGRGRGDAHDRTTQRYAHLASDVVRDGLEAATDRIVGATRGVAMLEPPPFERLTGRQWKRIVAIVEATRGTCGGTHGPAAGCRRDPLGPAQRR